MSKNDPKRKPAWTAKPVPCEDCGRLLEYDFWRPGPSPSVCRSCQNKRYDARTKGTPEGQRRSKRRTLLAKLRRLEARIERDQRTLVQVRVDLKATSTGWATAAGQRVRLGPRAPSAGPPLKPSPASQPGVADQQLVDAPA